jgi:hypothetical protein
VSPEADNKKASAAWSLLRTGGYEATGLEIPTVQTGVMSPTGPVRLALGEGGAARILLPLRAREPVQGLPETPSLRIAVSEYTSGNTRLRFLDITCLVPDLEPVFAELASEILKRVGSGVNCVVATRSTILDFRALLLQPPRGKITLATIAGLVGELLVLNRLLDRSAKAWRVWRGPAGDRHDFRSANRSLEVKTTTRAGNTVLSVSSIEQMEPPSGGRLQLLHVVLESVPVGLLSVSALGRAALAKADERDRLRELLTAIGCADPDADEWNEATFRLEAEQLYEVRDQFPRLIPSMLVSGQLPAGVGALTYQIDLAAAAAYRCDSAETEDLEQELIECLHYD